MYIIWYYVLTTCFNRLMSIIFYGWWKIPTFFFCNVTRKIMETCENAENVILTKMEIPLRPEKIWIIYSVIKSNIMA